MKNRNKILVVDVESTCWDTKMDSGKNISEIIEIGVTEIVKVVDSQEGPWELGDTLSYPITPKYSQVSAFCTHLTGWTPEDLQTLGRPYTEVIDAFTKRHAPKEAIVACWGKYDDKMFQEMAKLYQAKYPFNNDYLNVKALYATIYGGAMGVSEALERVGEQFEGRPHNGGDDSRNIAKLLLRVINRL